MMKKIIISAVVVLVLVAVGFFVSKPAGSDTLTIGFIGPLSGDGAPYGEVEKNALQIAVEEVNNDGGISGKKVQVIFEDGKCNGKDALTAINKLISVNKVNIIFGGTCSSETLAIAPIAEKNKVLLFSAFSSSPLITDAGDYIFRNGPSDADVAKVDAELMASKFKKVAMLNENTDYSIGVATVINDIFKEKGVEVIFEENYNIGLKDFRAVLAKVKAANPDVLYLNPGTDTKSGGIMARQARELGITIPIVGNFSLATQDAINAGGKYMDGVISTDGTGLSEKGKKLVEKYVSLYGVAPLVEYEAGSSYDRLFILKKAIEEVGTNPTKIKDYFYKMPSFDGAVGTYHFDKNGDVIGVGYMSVVLKDGQKIPLK